ncbi:hypothetical protein CEXT_759391 [Caerostris extrusa]|uniref:Uncharacterized protein n=1 Tax=Caerostris extrusa TaxID=172846 RepID=A0AAV4NTY7_CAEEX|nr:hypothetical protein CEXT_759391 [Caerostris extrusa]
MPDNTGAVGANKSLLVHVIFHLNLMNWDEYAVRTGALKITELPKQTIVKNKIPSDSFQRFSKNNLLSEVKQSLKCMENRVMQSIREFAVSSLVAQFHVSWRFERNSSIR